MHTSSSHHQWGWLAPYGGAIIGVLVGGSVLAGRPALQHLAIPSIGISASAGIHLLAHVLGLGLAFLVAHRAAAQLPDDGAGATFFRAILRPLASLAICILAGRKLGELLAPFASPDLHYYGKWALLAATVGSGAWLTAAWLGHTEALSQLLHAPASLAAKPPAQEADPDDLLDEAPVPSKPGGKSHTSIHEPDEAVGDTLGRYKILKELGRGSMGIVYLGKDPTIQRFVAIKTVPLDRGDDEGAAQEIQKSFFREAESTGRLSHPNIVTIYDAGEQDSVGYIAMEYLEGVTLKAMCQPGKLLPLSQAVNVVVTVADALDYAHRQGVVHRDIKPANIMLTHDHRIKVMDFGIARMASSTKTHSSVTLGTPSYMAPEQAAGKKVDGRADIFSLGIVLYELLAGRRPFQGDDVVSLLFQICKEPHPPITTHRSDLPSGLIHALEQALKKDPAHRYAKAGDFGQALRVALQASAA